METKQNILKGAMILSIGVMLSKIIGLVYRIPLVNIIGDKGSGAYTSVYQVYLIILTLTATAIPAGLSKLIAEREAVGEYREAHRILKLTLMGCFVCSLTLALFVSIGADWISDTFFPGEHIGMPIRILTPTILLATLIAGLRGYFQGIGNMVPSAKSQVIEQLVHVVCTVILAYWLIQKSLMAAVEGAVLGTSIGAMAALVILMWQYRKASQKRKYLLENQITMREERKKDILKRILEIIVPIVISTSVFAITTFIDLSMISRVLPKTLMKLQEMGQIGRIPVIDAAKLTIEDLSLNLKGQYGFQYNTFINIPVSLILQIAAASIPAIAASFAIHNMQETNNKIKVIFKLGMIIGAPCAIAFLVFGKPIIGLVVKNGTGGELLSAGAIGLIFITLAQLSAAIIQAMGKPLRVSIHAVIACLIKVILNGILLSMPWINIYGVIYSTTICYAAYSLFNLVYLYRRFSVSLAWKEIVVKPIFCSLLMGVISYGVYLGLNVMFNRPRLSMLAVMPIAVIIYFMSMVLTKAIMKEDLKGIPLERIWGKFIKE